MDALTPVLMAMRTGRPRSFRIECHSPWGRRYQPVPGAGFHIVLQGSCWLMPADGEPLALGVGDVVLLPHGHGHGLADSPDTPLVDLDDTPGDSDPSEQATVSIGPDREDSRSSSAVVLCGAYRLDQAHPHPLVSELPETVHLPSRLGLHPRLRAAVELLSSELANPQHGVEMVVPALLDVLLLYILRAWYDQQPVSDANAIWAAALKDPAISSALANIHHHPEQPWTIEALAAESGLSRAPFARRFTTVIGRPPLAYLTWWRMSTAARLLRDADVPLRTIARKVGYTSEFAFANAFKREYGIAPGRYRRDTSMSTSAQHGHAATLLQGG